MQTYSKVKKVLAVLVLSLFFTGCAIKEDITLKYSDNCNVEQQCHLKGKLSVFQESDKFGTSSYIGILDLNEKCYALALPGKVYSNPEEWNGKTVSLKGYAVKYGAPDSGKFIIVKDRRAPTNQCTTNKVLIYVDEIKAEIDHGCSIGDYCYLKGKLRVSMGITYVGILNRHSECYALALPGFVYSNSEVWDEKEVWLKGKAFDYSAHELQISVSVKDRMVAAGNCTTNNSVIYVDEIKVM